MKIQEEKEKGIITSVVLSADLAAKAREEQARRLLRKEDHTMTAVVKDAMEWYLNDNK